jgi:hypothetical protein
LSAHRALRWLAGTPQRTGRRCSTNWRAGDWPGRYRKDYAVNPAIKRGEV